MSSQCPDTTRLADLLEERLAPEEHGAIVDHVERCSLCQQHLQRMTEGGSVLGVLDRPLPEAGVAIEAAPHLAAAPTPTPEPSHPASGDGPPPTEPAATATFHQAAGPPETSPGGAVPDGPSTAEAPDASSTQDPPPKPSPAATITVNPAVGSSAPAKLAAAGTAWPEVPGYEIEAILGRGGMGVVYRARQQKLNRLVALKMIRDGHHAHPDRLARFRFEAEAVARLRHVNILQIYDIGEAEGLPFVTLELLDGGTLADRVAGATMPRQPAAALIATLARAIHEAHRAGIVHRDLKPGNVLFTAEGTPKIADFGLAKRLQVEGEPDDHDHTGTGHIMGSPSYMAPEQASGRNHEIGPATMPWGRSSTSC